MPDARDYVTKNEAELRRLRAVCDRVREGDSFDRKAEGGWSVSAVLAHLGFWDREVTTALLNWQALPPDELASRIAARDGWIDGETAEPWVRLGIEDSALHTMTIDQLNAAIAPAWSAMPGIEAARMAEQSAAELDTKLAALTPEIVQMMRDGGKGWMLDAWEHRAEHIAAIEAALGR